MDGNFNCFFFFLPFYFPLFFKYYWDSVNDRRHLFSTQGMQQVLQNVGVFGQVLVRCIKKKSKEKPRIYEA